MITKLIEKKEVAEGTMSFTFEKPEGYTFKAGQNIDVTLVNPSETDQEGNSRTFSIIASPQDDTIGVATRIRDTAFKRVLKNLPIGSDVEITEAMGSFTLHKDENKPAVFLIGGIGITPVRSIVLDAAKNKLAHKLFLFYSNRRPEDTAFLDELKNLEKQNANYKLIATMTQMEKSKQAWDGETGYITAEMIKRHIPDMNAVWYVSGPASMVKSMRGILTEIQADEDFIKTEEYSGY